MQSICLTPVWRFLLVVALLTPVHVLARESRGVVCLPDSSGQGWRCSEDLGQRPVTPARRVQQKSTPRAADDTIQPDQLPAASVTRPDAAAGLQDNVAPQVNAARQDNASPQANAAPQDNIDALTGLSNDPADWYIEAVPRPTDETHVVSGDLAERIYVRKPSDDGYCPGEYVVRDYPQPVAADDSDYPLTATADGLSVIFDQDATLAGNVSIEQGNLRLLAPSAAIDQQSRVVTFDQGVVLDRPGVIIQGQRAEVNTATNDAELEDVQFVLLEPGLRGSADTMAQNGAGDLSLERNEFTRCEPGNNGWRLKAKSLVIENDEVFGTARHAVLRMKNVPVFYTPYLKFPVTDDRVSGFLFPNISFSDEDGIDVSVPYYLNLAPNYDATLVPRVVGERGVGLETEFRHMSSWQNTTLAAGMLPEDKLFNGTLDRDDYEEQGGAAVFGPFDPADRWLGSVDHSGYFGNFRTRIDYTAASDREYFRDLGSDLGLSSRRALERRGEIQYARGGFNARLWAQRFQRLDEITTEEYRREPELDLSYTTPLVGLLEFDIAAKLSEFDRETEDLSGLAAVTGSRMHVEPRLRLPLSWPYGFLTFGGGYRYTTYDLDQDDNAGGFQLVDDTPDRNIGLGYVDGGLFFERTTNLFNKDLIHTLEPRVYYLWQEFEDQSALPRFDATDLTFGYSQLFRDNRFSGLDRIGDANQVSAGVTTRFIDASSGREYFRASVGEIFYLEDRRVTLSGNQSATETQSSSALAGEVAASLGGPWRIFGNIVWDPHDNEVDEGGGGIGYRRDNRHIFNLGFRNRRDSDVEQGDISLYWPLGKRMAIMGRWNYDLVSGRTIEGFGGLEYSDCCLQVRLLARRFLDSRSDNFAEVEGDDGIFLQIVFKGLAGFGTKVESVLERGIRGYRSPAPSDYFSN